MRRFTLSVLLALLSIGWGMAAELNIYASGLRLHGATPVTGQNQVHIDYFLNAPATDLKFVVLDATTGAEKTSVDIPAGDANANYAKGAHSDVVVDLSGYYGGGETYKWAIRATGTTVNNYSKRTDESEKYQFYGGRGIAVDNSFESDYFGTAYVTNFGGTSTMNAKRATQTGVYAFGPGLNQINSSAYTGGLTWGGNSGVQWAIGRPGVGPDGTVYVTSGSATNSGVWMMDPSNPAASFTPIFGGTHTTTTGTTKNGDVTIHNSVLHCYVEGFENARKLYTFDLTTVSTGGNILRYDIGSLASVWVSAPSATIYNDDLTGNNKINNGDCSIAPDARGGWWISQHRGVNGGDKNTPALIHITNGSIDYNSETNIPTAFQGGMAVSTDGNVLAIGTTRSTIKIYDITYNANNEPTLTARSVPIPWGSERNAKGMAFDVAKNLYVIDNNNEMFAVFATHGATEFTTPAASSRTIVLESYTPLIHVTGVELDETAKTVKVGDAFTLTATVLPSDASDKTYSWSTTNSSVASVVNGVVTANAAGSATITVTTTDGEKTATCDVTVEPYTITYNTNGGTLSKTNQELWEDFKPAYNAYYGLSRSDQPIANVTTFANEYMQDFMTDDASAWKWLGDYIFQVTTDASRSINTDVLWRFGVSAFFNCSAEATSTWNGNADFTTAGQPSAWLPAYITAMLPAHVTGTYTLPTLTKENYTFTGWTNAAGELVTSVDALADYSLTAHWTLTNPTNLEEAVAGKSIRRTLMNNGSLFVLAIDELKKPYIYKINPESSAVEAIIPTTGCSNSYELTTTTGLTTMPLSDIAFTDDDVLVGMNADHMNVAGTQGVIKLYKWASLTENPIVWASSHNASAAGNFYDAITAVAFTFVGNSQTGTSQAIAIAGSQTSPSEYRYVLMNLSDGVHQNTRFNRSVISGGTSDIKATTIGTNVQLQPSPLTGDFVILGGLCRPIEVIENATSGEAATYNKTEVISAPSVGSFFMEEEAVKYMFIPTSAGVSIYNVTTGLATATSIKTIESENTASYRAVFAKREGNNLILYFQKDDVITKLIDTDFFGVTINSVTLNEDAIDLVVGETQTLEATVDPSTAVVTVLWSSSDEDVATVSNAGVVTAVAAGTANITATAGDKSDICAVSVTALLPLAGQYTVGGENPDYPSLFAACNDINTRSLSANVEFLICADLTEPQNIGLVNTSDYTLTIRPNADADRTITFTQSTDNPGAAPSGAFVIGIKMDKTTGEIGTAATETKNIILDGYAEGGSTRRLTWKTTTGFGSKAGPIVFWGHVTDCEVKNSIIVNDIYHTSTSAYGITLRNELNTDNAPEGIVIENNEINVNVAYNGQCICLNGSQAATPKTGAPKNTIIRNNILNAATRGIFLYGANGATIEGNTFNINQVSGGRLSHGILGNSQTGVITVRANKFMQLATVNATTGAYGINAITAEGGATRWDIENNYISGFAAGTACVGKNTRICGIYMKDLCNVRHNTLVMPALDNKPSTALVADEPITLIQYKGTAAHVVANNIFVSQETEANNSLVSGALNSAFENNVLYHAGGNAAIVAGDPTYTAFADLPDDARDANIDQKVTFSSTYHISDTYVGNLNLGVAPISGITSDIDGNTRHNPTYAGCYEANDWSTISLYLDETQSNTANIAAAAAAGVPANVIFNRRFSVAEGWYTLVLPFDLTAAQMAEAFGADYRLCELETSYLKSETMMYLRFRDVDDLEAGKPYLFKTGVDITDDIVFNAVTINNATPQVVTDKVTMIGLYDQTVVGASDLNYYLGYEDYLYEYLTDKTTKAFRCYFHFASPSLIQGRNARVIFRDDVTTDLEDETFETAPAVQKIIRNGQLIIIRDGVEYNAQGQVVK